LSGEPNESESSNPIEVFIEAGLPEQAAMLAVPTPIEPNSAVLEAKNQIKDLLIEDLGKALQSLKNKLKTHTETYDDLIGLFARYNRMTRYLQKGVLDIPAAESEFVKIENAVIFVLNRLDREDLI
jgi:hypothetical protein